MLDYLLSAIRSITRAVEASRAATAGDIEKANKIMRNNP
jgi:hypothetical protein